MLDRLRDYMVAVVAAVIACVFLIGVALSLTVWKPAQEVVATTEQQHPLVMTRERVLPLLAQEVVVSVKAGPSDHVAVVFGATSDVRGWIHDAAFTEVIGLEAGYKTLMIEGHDVPAPGDAPQSGDSAQSGDAVQSANIPQSADTAQSSDAAQSGDGAQSDDVQTVAEVLASNDMWVNAATGIGEAHLRLSDLGGDVSVLAASSGENPTLTLTWAVRSTNVVLIVCSILAGLFAAIAAYAAVRQLMLERSRVARAAQIEARQSADITDTTTLSVEEIAAYGAEHEANAQDEPTDDAPHADAPGDEDTSRETASQALADAAASTTDDGDDTAGRATAAQDTVDQVDADQHGDGHPIHLLNEDHADGGVADTGTPAEKEDSPGTAPVSITDSDADSTGDGEGDTAIGFEPDPEPEPDAPHGMSAQSDAQASAGNVSDRQPHHMPDVESDKDSDSESGRELGTESVDTADTASEGLASTVRSVTDPHPVVDAETTRVVARHASSDGPHDVDPPETVPTDTGTIDLTSIRPGAILPSRRALREARERGEASVVIDGHEFDTGLIPKITRVDAEEIRHLTDVDVEHAPAHVDEYIYDSSQEDTDDTPKGTTHSTGGWTSMMSTWMRGRNHEGDTP